MKITTEGLKSLSISREPTFNETVNSYLIYEWKGIEYYASLIKPGNLAENQIFIEVNEEQFLTISKEDTYASKVTNLADLQKKPEQETPSQVSQVKTVNGTSNLSVLSQVTAKYKSALLLKYDQDTNTLLLEDLVGETTPKDDFKISLKHPSPFRITLQTLKPYHGSYTENETINKIFNQCGINPLNLWVTAHPIVENKQLIGMLVGLSNDVTHELADLKIFEGIDHFAKQMLLSETAQAA